MLGPEVGGGLHTFVQRINNLVGIISCYLQGRVAGRAPAGMDDAEVRAPLSVIDPPVLLLQVVQDALAELVRHLHDLQVEIGIFVRGEQGVAFATLAHYSGYVERVFHFFSSING